MVIRTTRRLSTIMLCFFYSFTALAQVIENDYPVVGKPLPEFRLINVHHYGDKTFDPRSLKGKWIILDFWNKACVSCVHSFPKVNKLQEEFKDRVQFLLVGQNDKKYNWNIEQVFERYRKTLDLNLASAYDSVLFSRFKIQGVPHVIIIDPAGIVYAVTFGSELTQQNIQLLISNQHPKFKRNDFEFISSRILESTIWKYGMENSNDENDFLYRSILSKNKGEVMTGTWMIDQNVSQGFYHVERATLGQLYCLAYFGQANWGRRDLYFTHWKYPILAMKDSSLFQFDYSKNSGFYNYSISIPKDVATKERLMQMMQRDLKNYFGYEVMEETRLMPYWKLTAVKEMDRLATKSKEYQAEVGPSGVSAKRIAPENILDFIELYDKDKKMPFIDATNLSYIDINFSAAMTELDDVRKALRKQGLLLEESKKEMIVLVISGSKSIY